MTSGLIFDLIINEDNNVETDFKTNLLKMANRIRTDAGYKTNDDYQKSSSLVASDIMVKIHADKLIFPSDESLGLIDAITSSIMMCLICSNIADNLNSEGIKVNVLEIVPEVGKTTYALLAEDTRKTIISKGFENYQMLANAVYTQEQIKKFIDAMYKVTTSYIIASGMNVNQEMQEKLIYVYSQQFDELKTKLD